MVRLTPIAPGVVLASDVVKVVRLLIAVMVVPGGKPPPETEAPTTRPAVLATVTINPVALIEDPAAAVVPGVEAGGTAIPLAPAVKVVADVPAFELPAALYATTTVLAAVAPAGAAT